MRCLACEGSGWIRKKVASKIYDCGYFVVADVCRFCKGTKEAPANQAEGRELHD